MENIQELKRFLATPRDVLITSHRNPDGDAVGSSMALYHFLVKFGHTVRILMPSEFPASLAWIPSTDEIIIFDIEPDRGKEVIEKADFIFALDYNDLERVDKMGEIIATQTCPKALIDHHLYPEPFAEYVLSDTSASSTCELIFDFIGLLEQRQYFDTLIAECIFSGILTDTGSFKYSVSPKLFRTVADLLEMGVDDQKVQNLIFNSVPEKMLRLLGYCLYERMEILEEFHTGIITLTKEDYERFSIQRGDTEGIVNFMLQLKVVKMAVFIHEQPKITKLSLRSKGDFSVQEIAKEHFRGGGHKNASGGASFAGLEATIKKFKRILPEYKELLDRA